MIIQNKFKKSNIFSQQDFSRENIYIYCYLLLSLQFQALRFFHIESDIIPLGSKK